MKIGIVHPFAFPEVRRGGERYLDDLAWYLARHGHTVEVVTGSTGESRVEVDSLGVRYRRLRHIAPERLQRHGVTRDHAFGGRALPSLVRRRFDVVHALMPTAALAARLAGHRVVYTLLGHPTLDQLAALPPAERRLHRAATRFATVTAALSEASAGSATSVFGFRPAVLPPGVRTHEFEPDRSPRSGPPRLLFTADASLERKGLHHLFEAMDTVLDAEPDARVQVAGPGDHTWALDRLGPARAARVRAAVDVLGTGTLDELPGRYRSATVTVLPSWNEAFGLVLVESLATGTPVVCTTSGGMAEIVEGHGVGAVVEPERPDQLAAAVIAAIRMARDPAVPPRCVQRAAAFGWDESVGPLHERIYEQVRRRARPTAPA